MRGSATPIIAQITPSSVVRADGRGGRYTRMDRCLVEIDGKSRVRTVMAFGQANARVTRRLAPGRPLRFECAWDGPVLQILGWPPKEAAKITSGKES